MIRVYHDTVLHFVLAASFWIIASLDLSTTLNLFPLFPIVTIISFISIVYRALLTVRTRGAFRFLLYSAHVTAAWTLFGQLQSFYSFYRINNFNLELLYYTDYVDFIVKWNYLSIALSYILLYTGFLSLLTTFKYVTVLEDKVNLLFSSIFRRQTKALLQASTGLSICLSLFLAFLVFTGSLGFQGANLDVVEGYTISWWAPVVTFAVRTIPLTGSIVLLIKPTSNLYKVINALSIIVTLYVVFTVGRRAIVFFIISFIYCIIYFMPGIANSKLHISIRKIILAIILFAIAMQLTTAFQYIRTVGLVEVNPSVILDYLTQLYSNPDLLQDVADRTQENLVTRPLVHSSFAAILQQGSKTDYILFDDLLGSFLYSLPRVLVPFKTSLVITKTFVTQAFGTYTDHSVNLALYAYLSFGLLGALVYPMVQLIVYLATLWAFKKTFVQTSSIWLLLLYGGYFINMSTKGFPEGQSIEIFRPLVELFAISLPFIFVSLFRGNKYISQKG